MSTDRRKLGVQGGQLVRSDPSLSGPLHWVGCRGCPGVQEKETKTTQVVSGADTERKGTEWEEVWEWGLL